MSEPLVSVIIAVGEWTHRLPEVLESALEQSADQIEVIASVTPSLFDGELKRAVNRHAHRTRVVVPKEDTTIGGLLRAGVEQSQGRFISWLTPDDVYDPRRIEQQLAALASIGKPAVTACYSLDAERPGVRDRTTRVLREPPDALLPLMAGEIDPRTLLVPRACLQEVGGFDPDYHALQGLDLAVRLARSFPFVHAPTTLMRHRRTASEHAPETNLPQRASAESERERIWLRLFQELAKPDGAGWNDQAILNELRRFASLAQRTGVSETPELRRWLVEIASHTSLMVAVVADDAANRPQLGTVQALLGLPRAEYLMLQATAREPSRAIEEALSESHAGNLILVDANRPPPAELVAAQTLRLLSEELDACLPMADPLIYDPTPADSLLIGTLFTRPGLQRVAAQLADGRTGFGSALQNAGRIGALPADPVVRPHQGAEQTTPRSPVTSKLPALAKQNLSAEELVAALVEPDWYSTTYPDVIEANLDPVEHYLRYGWRERRDPSPWFNTAWYLTQIPQISDSNTNPLEHFVRIGAASGVRPQPRFNLAWYARRYLENTALGAEALWHFMSVGLPLGAVPDPRLDRPAVRDRLVNGTREAQIQLVQRLLAELLTDEEVLTSLIDADWYLTANHDVAEAGMEPGFHYRNYGFLEGRNPNPWFDTIWYLAQNPVAGLRGACPLEHFVSIGGTEGRRPSSRFDLTWYAKRYLDLDSPHAAALGHFLTTGLAAGAVPEPQLDKPYVKDDLLACPMEQRRTYVLRFQGAIEADNALPHTLVDASWYRSAYPETTTKPTDAAADYYSRGWHQGRDPNPWFDTNWYLAQDKLAGLTDLNPLSHFVSEGAAKGLSPHQFFDLSWYARRYLHSDRPSIGAFTHFLTVGQAEGCLPDPRLDRSRIRHELDAVSPAQRPGVLLRLRDALQAEEALLQQLVDGNWYCMAYPQAAASAADAARHYHSTGWRDQFNPNEWFYSSWYADSMAREELGEMSPLEHFVRAGAAAGRNPHPYFDLTWYAKRYLGGSKPNAQALRHFLTVGLQQGAVPNPDIDITAVHDRLRETARAERTALLQRLYTLYLQQGCTDRYFWQPGDSDLWPLLLRRNAPRGLLPVLLIAEAGSAATLERARGAALVLPMEESPLFGLIEGDMQFRIVDRLDDPQLSVYFRLPEQSDGLKTLLGALPCRRAAILDQRLAETRIVRTIRNALVPLFANGPDRAAA